MACTAELARIHLIHRHLAMCFFHIEQFGMTFLTGEHAYVEFVAEYYVTHALGLILQLFVKPCHVVTS